MKRALLVIDVQNEYFTGKLPIAHPPGSLDNIVKAMEQARKSGIPVVVVQHTSPQKDAPVFRKGSEGWNLHPRIAAQAYDHLIEKNLPGSFTGTDLESWLRERKIDTIVIAGYMTQMCCDYDGPSGLSRGPGRGVSVGRHRDASRFQQGRERDRRGTAPGDPGHPGHEVQQGHDHRPVDRKPQVERRKHLSRYFASLRSMSSFVLSSVNNI